MVKKSAEVFCFESTEDGEQHCFENEWTINRYINHINFQDVCNYHWWCKGENQNVVSIGTHPQSQQFDGNQVSTRKVSWFNSSCSIWHFFPCQLNASKSLQVKVSLYIVETLMSWHIIFNILQKWKFSFSFLSICVYILILVWLWNLKHGGS